MEICSAYKNAQKELVERVLRVQACWLQIHSQLEFLREIASSLQPRHLTIHLDITRILDGKLQFAISHLESFFKTTGTNGANDLQGSRLILRPWKYAFMKDKLDHSIADLEVWQKIFDPSWYLILRVAEDRVRAKISEEIAKSDERSSDGASSTANLLRAASVDLSRSSSTRIFLSRDGFDAMVKQDIPCSTAKIAHRQSSNTRESARWYIVETIACPKNTRSDIITRTVRHFALTLSRLEPHTFGLLRCKGVVRHQIGLDTEIKFFTFVFWVPDGAMEPASLRQLLLTGSRVPSLAERVRIAKELARAVSFVHVLNFVHKGVRPEAILLLRNGSLSSGNDSSSLGSAFLAGFDRIRSAEGHTFRLGSSAWQKNLYQHPERQGEGPEEYFVMQHDIYSLGVCLLEIGLWQSFIVIAEDGKEKLSDVLASFFSEVETARHVFGKPMKDHLVALAKTELPQRVGDRYTEVVVTCLTCLDRENLDFGNEKEFEDQDGIIVGLRFIEKVSVCDYCIRNDN
jgi:hypothetical protein